MTSSRPRRAAGRRSLAAACAALALAAAAAASPAAAQAAARAPGAQPPDGAKLYGATCASCHQAGGQGAEGSYPPLAGSEWVESEERLVRILLHGLTGEVEVAGETYRGLMPPWGGALKDAELAAVASYVRSSFGNRAAPVAAATVARVRAATAARKAPWTAAELARVP